MSCGEPSLPTTTNARGVTTWTADAAPAATSACNVWFTYVPLFYASVQKAVPSYPSNSAETAEYLLVER